MPEVDSSIVELVALVIATTSTLIAYLLYRFQRDPEVVVYATDDETRPSVVILVIENTGGSVALDVSFTSSKPLPDHAFGFENAPQPKEMKSGPLITGIPSLGPRARRVITWGQYYGIHKGIGDSVVDVTATYYSLPFLGFRRRHETVSRLDIKSFANTDASDHNWDRKTAEALKKIADAIAPLSTPAKQLLAASLRERESKEP